MARPTPLAWASPAPSQEGLQPSTLGPLGFLSPFLVLLVSVLANGPPLDPLPGPGACLGTDLLLLLLASNQRLDTDPGPQGTC